MLELDEDVEGMQSTIYFLQQQLRQTREQLTALQKENEKLQNGNGIATETSFGNINIGRSQLGDDAHEAAKQFVQLNGVANQSSQLTTDCGNGLSKRPTSLISFNTLECPGMSRHL